MDNKRRNDESQEHQSQSKKPRRKNVSSACLYCRRSHMTCDQGRPCQRCIKRNIPHLCHDPPSKKDDNDLDSFDAHTQPIQPTQSTLVQPPPTNTSLGFDLEFGGSLDDLLNALGMPENLHPNSMSNNIPYAAASTSTTNTNGISRAQTPSYIQNPKHRFFFTAANPPIHSTREERLKAVLTAKHEAGLLKPFNYVNGYAKLGNYLNQSVSPRNRVKIQSYLSRIRSQFANIASDLSEWDLTTTEESFERLLLDYDRVFSMIALPSCCWRRTGEIYKANREFADIVGCDVDTLKTGEISVHELLDEDSLTNYWSKYAQLAFNFESKGVLTAGSLINKHNSASIPCNFSFNIRRDAFGIPLMIVANFMPLS
ncbi:hypothetical protein E3P81_03249 [Wallemia ichthyophaga]|nr:hypothetical protein E3P97_02387 [Wallemia ichthyophaga]TIB01314.1 hypothetical protein E3P96_02445 [Wallemia ichthyophaga]TIB29789.1 hypothetical protein E3P85_03006 [Wallemia ichthyophaga]TIB44915.1 hypothetical protein E3P82_03254 [Wallemia ichthyophaga]TIB47552.1 hypothetical protein E3P81_03249 [Wallemia ichthyophaga]